MATTVFTIGYEGTNVETFIAEIKRAGIKTLADVRAVPLSRKKGFSKRALESLLKVDGIVYLHLRDLGDPKPGRDAARAKRYSEFRGIYAAHLETTLATSALDSLARVAASGATCLLCFERDPGTCHRSIIAERLQSNGMTISHLFVGATIEDAGHAAKSPRRDFGQGASAAQ